MGTNFYLQRKVNAEGRRHDLHICKLSGGWTPSMQAYAMYDHEPTIKTWFDWKMFLRNEIKNNEGLIFNEYDEYIPYDVFVKKIEEWQAYGIANNYSNHARCANEGQFGNDFTYNIDCWVDPQGYSFNLRDFS